MKIIYHAPLCHGSTSLQRAEALARLPGVEVVPLDTEGGAGWPGVSFYARVRWRLGRPVDSRDENGRLLDMARRHRPDVIIVDNSKVISCATLATLKADLDPVLVYYSPDDMMARHNMKLPLRRSLGQWDVVLTTKSYNVAELKAAGARKPVLVGNAFDPQLHRPLTPSEVGPEWERFDLVFIGAFEAERCRSINALAAAGMSVLVHGTSPGLLAGKWRDKHPAITLREPVHAEDYARGLHRGKIALCFLRKINRDRITTRSIEIPAMARPMLAEKTDEHDTHFVDGREYMGFGEDEDLTRKAKALVGDPDRRARMGEAGRRRCVISGYSTRHRAEQTMAILLETMAERSGGGARTVAAMRNPFVGQAR